MSKTGRMKRPKAQSIAAEGRATANTISSIGTDEARPVDLTIGWAHGNSPRFVESWRSVRRIVLQIRECWS